MPKCIIKYLPVQWWNGVDSPYPPTATKQLLHTFPFIKYNKRATVEHRSPTIWSHIQGRSRAETHPKLNICMYTFHRLLCSNSYFFHYQPTPPALYNCTTDIPFTPSIATSVVEAPSEVVAMAAFARIANKGGTGAYNYNGN